MYLRVIIVCLAALNGLQAQGIRLTGATRASYPVSIVDGNSPSIWVGDTLRVYTSTGQPLAMAGSGLFSLQEIAGPVITPSDHYPIWIESVWMDDDGTIYGWYHNEPGGVCSGNSLTAPKIGAVVSTDGGSNFRDLGIVLSTGEALNCSAQNGYFAGGHGDFSVIPDRDRGYFYFLFGNYSGPVERQGVATARMAFKDRAEPVGAVYKYYGGEWSEPGVGGKVTPIFPATVSWEKSNTDAFWGPAIHWNTHLNSYVVMLNRACCKSGWPQEGIYVAMNADLGNPSGWQTPAKVLDASSISFSPAYYPQVVGTGAGETDSLAGKTARLYVKGQSSWELEFLTADEVAAAQADTEPDPSTSAFSIDGAQTLSQTPVNGAGTRR